MSQLFKAIIVDDEPAARRLIRSLLKEYSDVIEVISEAGNGGDAIDLINELQPDVVFLDIQLPDLTGFEVIDRLQKKTNIIFTTAYEQYAIKAFETFSIDYLLKPIKEERLEQSIAKLKQFGKLTQHIDLSGLQEIISQFKVSQKATALPIKTGSRINLIRYENISYLDASDKFVFIYTIDGQKHITDLSLSALEEKLPPQFYRIQKSNIINKEKIKEMHRHFNSRYLFIMDDKAGTRLISGRTYHDAIKIEFGL